MKGKSKFSAQLVKYAGEKPELKSEDEVKKIIEKIKSSECKVATKKTTEKTVRPKPPFTSNYSPQFFIRTADISGKITLPKDKEMVMPGDNSNMTVELQKPLQLYKMILHTHKHKHPFQNKIFPSHSNGQPF